MTWHGHDCHPRHPQIQFLASGLNHARYRPGRNFSSDLAIGVAAGFLFDRFAGPSWFARQFAGSTRGVVTSALVGVAGAFVGYQIAVLLALGAGLVTSIIAAAVGAAAVLFAWRMAK